MALLVHWADCPGRPLTERLPQGAYCYALLRANIVVRGGVMRDFPDWWTVARIGPYRLVCFASSKGCRFDVGLEEC